MELLSCVARIELSQDKVIHRTENLSKGRKQHLLKRTKYSRVKKKLAESGIIQKMKGTLQKEQADCLFYLILSEE